jgi:hypothetical protein
VQASCLPFSCGCLSALYIIDNNLAPIMSVSYGYCEAFLGVGGNAFYKTTREQGAAQGITIINSANASGSPQTVSLTGTGVQPTPAGNYTLTVEGTNGATHTVQVQVIVQ